MKIPRKIKILFPSLLLLLAFCLLTLNFFPALIYNFPTVDYLKNSTINSIKEANNFSWESYTGIEGKDYFTSTAQRQYFGQAVDLDIIRQYQIESEGTVEKFIEIDPKVPSTRFVTYRSIKDNLGKEREYRSEIEYVFKREKGKWLIDKINNLGSWK